MCKYTYIGSMSQIITAAKDAVGEMFGRAGEIIDEHLGKGTDKFEMQFAVFRNYSRYPPKSPVYPQKSPVCP